MTDAKKLNGRSIYLPRGREPTEDACILADAIATSAADLFELDGSVFWIVAGRKVPVTPGTLREISAAYIVTKVPVETADGWQVELRPHEPDEMTLRNLLTARSLNAGSLAQRLPKAVGAHREIPEHLEEAVRMRLRSGEPASLISAAYGVSEDTVKAMRGRR